MIDETPAWRELSDREVEELAPVTLRAAGLGDDAVAGLWQEAREMTRRSYGAAADTLGRELTEREFHMLVEAVVSHLNRYRIPELRAREVLH
ncbi:hypothetical protein [Microbulbifer sp.]|uniref:hypothetical protein n=1 Tax=Microbulbifer sp. TaxID=1908541 RepID=UPI003F2A1086